MAVVYFTSNASTGAGSLAEAIQNAAPGDVIRPDESVFERGATIEIVLAATLSVDKSLTLDGGPFRVRLNGSNASRCVDVAGGANVELTAFELVGGATSLDGGGLNVANGANVVLNRCVVAGCDAAQNGGGARVEDGGALSLNDSAIYGNRAQGSGGGLYLGATANFASNGSTVAVNVDATSNGYADLAAATGYDATTQTPVNSIICVASSDGATLYDASTTTAAGSVCGVSQDAVGFVAPGGVSAPFDSWTANAWQNIDLRLFDDASGAPSLYRDSGDVGAASKYDLDGNFRGRETNGASTCSPGAYETIQADLFWVGVDATGAEVVAPSFLTSDGWAASRFATVSGDAAPQVGQTVFVDGAVTFGAFLSQTGKALKVGGGAVFASSVSSAVVRVSSLQVGLGATFNATFNAGSSGGRVGSWARLTQFGATSETIEFDVESRADYLRFFAGDVSTTPSYGRLEFRPNADLKLKISGVYNCSSLTIYHQDLNVSQLRIQADAATIRTKKLAFYLYHSRDLSLFSERVAFSLQDVATATFPVDAPESWADEFEFDVSNATSATLTLNGQTIYGDAPTAAVSLTGSAKIDGANLLTVSALTLEEGATVEFANDASVILTTVFATSATATGGGAFFAPIAAPVGLTLENGAVWGDASAGVTSLDVDPTSATTATFTVVKASADANIVAQYSDDDGATWRTVETTADVDEYELTVAQGADITVRVATAAGWLAETVSTAPFLPVWTVKNAFETVVSVESAFEVVNGGSNDGLNDYDFEDYGYL